MKAVAYINGHTLYAVSEGEQAKVPFFDSSIGTGFSTPAQGQEEEIDIVQLFNLNTSSVYMIRVAGDSMTDAHIPHRSFIAVDRKIKPQDRHLVVAILNQEFTIKRLLKTAAGWMLHPENPSYEPYLIKPEDDFDVWGVVTQIFINPNLYI
ncbi:LexA family protein [Chitinophaga lutea]